LLTSAPSALERYVANGHIVTRVTAAQKCIIANRDVQATAINRRERTDADGYVFTAYRVAMQR